MDSHFTGFAHIMDLLEGGSNNVDFGLTSEIAMSPSGSEVSSCSDASLHEFNASPRSETFDDLVRSLGMEDIFLRGDCQAGFELANSPSSETSGLDLQLSTVSPPTTTTTAEVSPAPTTACSKDDNIRDNECVDKPVRLRVPVTTESAREKNLRNAIAARENRRKKKNERETLEGKVKDLTEENALLKEQVNPLRARVADLEEEVSYLRSVLHNDSSLARLLKNIPVADVRLRPSARGKKRQSADGDCEPARKRICEQDKRGVCLHVCDDKVSLEFCKECSRNSA